MKDPLEMLVVMFKVYKTLHLDKYFHRGSEEEREHFCGAIIDRALWNTERTLKTHLLTVFLVSKNPINVNQPGITVLFLFDTVWVSLVKSVSAAP